MVQFRRRIHFYETDALGVVHHSNYFRLFEEARTQWMQARGLSRWHYPHTDLTLAVLECDVHLLGPIRYGEEIGVAMQVRRQGIRLEFRYGVQDEKGLWAATGRTVHAALCRSLKPRRLPAPLVEQLESEPWIETWPSNL